MVGMCSAFKVGLTFLLSISTSVIHLPLRESNLFKINLSEDDESFYQDEPALESSAINKKFSAPNTSTQKVTDYLYDQNTNNDDSQEEEGYPSEIAKPAVLLIDSDKSDENEDTGEIRLNNFNTEIEDINNGSDSIKIKEEENIQIERGIGGFCG